MSFSKQNRVLLARTIVAIAMLALISDMLGLFGGPKPFEAAVRALIFYPLTYIVFAAFPRNRRTDLALIMIQFALGAELLRTFILNIKDPMIWPLDTVSIMLATTPAAIQRMTYKREEDRAPAPPMPSVTRVKRR